MAPVKANSVTLVEAASTDSGARRVLEAWDYERNTRTSPDVIRTHQKIKIWTRCPNGHVSRAPINQLVRLTNCTKACRQSGPVQEKYSIAVTNRRLANEWSSSNGVPASTVSEKSLGNYTWECPKGVHANYLAPMKSRIQGQGCPQCNLNGTSLIETVLRDSFDHVLDYSPTNHLFKLHVSGLPKPIQVDIYGYFKGVKTVIEYDGGFHSRKESIARDIETTAALLEAGYMVVRLRGEELPSLEINHPHLLQLPFEYSRSKQHVLSARTNVTQWLNKTLREETPLFAALQKIS